MKKSSTLVVLTLSSVSGTQARELPEDTLKVMDVGETVVIAAPKENRRPRELPTAVTAFSQQDMQANRVNSIKSPTVLVPNIFTPDYGPRLTSAIYIHGIGSRISTPSVGLYMDNVPYIDKSVFDFNYADIERIDVLRGPQGALYGHNTMGGLIEVHIRLPFSYQGTDSRLGVGSCSNYNTSMTHYHRVSDQFAFSTSGFHEYDGGFPKNTYLNKRIDKNQAVNGRFRDTYLPGEDLKLDLNISHKYNHEGEYPYFYTGRVDPAERGDDPRKEQIGEISYNDESTHRRGLLNTGVDIEYQAQKFILSAVAGFQNLNDYMFLDQGFTEENLFNLIQKQRLNIPSEGMMLRSKPGSNWQWTTGAFGFYQWLNTDGPMISREDGVKGVIGGNANKAFTSLGPRVPRVALTVNNPTLHVSGNFDTPMLSGAVYHQSTFNNLFTEGLPFIIGLRLDYEKISMTYNSIGDPMDLDFNISMPPMLNLKDQYMKTLASFKDKLKNDCLRLLPKFALQYEWQRGNSVYTTVSCGYCSGRYSAQMFSDLVQNELKDLMKIVMMESDVFKKYTEMIGQMMPEEEIDVKASTTYKPERLWNCEAGAHLALWENRPWADLATYHIGARS